MLIVKKMMIHCEVPIYVELDFLFVTKLSFPSELRAAGAKQSVRSLPMRTVPSQRSTLDGRPGSSDDDDDVEGDDVKNYGEVTIGHIYITDYS